METLPIHDSFMRKAMQPTPHSSRSNKRCSKLVMPCFGLAVVLLLCLASPSCSCNEQEESSLLQFLAGLSQGGSLAASWRNGTDCCKWEGVTCSGNGAVIEVTLASRGLQGRISPSLASLTGLLRLNLSYNLFSGGLPLELMSSRSIIVLDVSFNRLNRELHELPSSVTTGRRLQVLNISSNRFTGEFPANTWKAMENLVELNASNNSFTGWIPSSFCLASPSFSVLDLSYNKVSGNIPPALGDCSMLRVLKVGHNNLSGTLPDELFNATSLEYLSFPNNGLQGELDGGRIAKLSDLATLDLGENNFSGKIPHSIGQLKRLEELHLGSNSMSGELPSTLGNCTHLITIDLKFNNFSGELGKVNFSTLYNLKVLDLMWNNFSGIVPESIYSCNNLTALRLSYNHFHGEISSRIGNLKYLSFLSLSRNSFTNITKAFHILKSSRNLTTLFIGRTFMNEAMPQDETTDGFENLQLLSLHHCSLTGKIPLWLSKLTNLEILDLSNNRFTGPIPRWIDSLNHLFHLTVSNNSLAGEIPFTLMEMPMLKSDKTAPAAYLDRTLFDLSIYKGLSRQYRGLAAYPALLNLSVNYFTGVISPQIGQLKMLTALDFSFNKLYGEIPQLICNLTNLQVLDLSSNHLTGAIPEALSSLNFLSKFNISNNDLEGPIPTGGQLSTFPISSFDGNPKLCGSMLIHHCNSVEAAPVSIISAKQCSNMVIFAIAFGLFFGVGVLYDQLVLSSYFG